ncbi:hypothetical protein AB0F18_25930 [Streptomyces sp. NPDC029216]|uniref:hypothetical protein n=1 Tax=Streptomyces sp. NPDC029216 TaxID=3154701 RepID=UPI0033DD7CC1
MPDSPDDHTRPHGPEGSEPHTGAAHQEHSHSPADVPLWPFVVVAVLLSALLQLPLQRVLPQDGWAGYAVTFLATLISATITGLAARLFCRG